MAMVALGTKGNVVHVYDFRVKKGRGDEFITAFDTFDYSDVNPFHKSSAQVKDGILCRDVNDPDHFYLLGEWKSVQAHRDILKVLRETVKPEFVSLIENGQFVPTYAEIVSSTPQSVLDEAAR
jgi:hypothetical protein